MSEPEDRATDRPEISTAAPGDVEPAVPAPRRRSGIPSHLGRARTSTVILAVLFLAIGFLYLNVRPDPVPTAQTGGGSDIEQPATPTTAPSSTTAPPTTTTTTAPTTTEPTPTEPTTTEPTTTTTPGEPGDTTAPVPPSEPPVPPTETLPGG